MLSDIRTTISCIESQPDDSIRLEVCVDDDTVWLNRQQMSELFDRDVKTIGKHVNNALAQELKGIPTIANFATIQKEGDRWVNRNVDFYNLDMILSVGYRVKSQRGVDFRRWANKVLKDLGKKLFAFSKLGISKKVLL